MKKIIATLIVLMVAVYSCKHEPALTPVRKDPTPPDTIPTWSSAICFNKDVLPIFTNYCANPGCHDKAIGEKDYVFDNYDDIIKKDITPGNAANSKIYKVIITTDPNDIMPPPGRTPLTQAQKDIIKKWIDEGAKNTTCTTTCNAGLFTYSGFIQPLLQKNCVGCHSGTNPAGYLNFTVFSIVQTLALNGKLYGSISQMPGYIPMPQSGAKLSDCQITQVKKWVDAGAPQN